MNILRTHRVNHVDFELWSTAVSAINDCSTCVDSREKMLRDKGVEGEKNLVAVRIASVVHALAKTHTPDAALRELPEPATVA